MSPALDAFLRSWPFDPWLLLALLLTAALYLRGWLLLRRRDPGRWGPGRLTAFLGGLFCAFLALASPIEPFSALLLSVHMLQHLLLMMAAPPLLWLGAPMLPLLRGLPRGVRLAWVSPLFRWAALRRLLLFLTKPLPAFLLFTAATWLWHVPPLYDLALRSGGWHYVQHLSFLGTGLLFWYIVVHPYPARPRSSRWLAIPFLILADVQNTLLSALLTFSDRVLYPYYAEVPRLGGLSALEDQSAAGVLMWVPGSLVYLLPVFGIGIRLLYGPCSAEGETKPGFGANRIPLPLIQPRGRFAYLASGGRQPPVPGKQQGADAPRSPTAGFDLLRLPLLGRFLRWRHARMALQIPLLVLAGVVIVDGLCGPEVAPLNLAGVLPWVHWRGLVVFGLLVAGNVFCMGCPFLVPRTLARRWLPASRPWPRRLRSKWPALALLAVFLWSYEAFALWDSPWWTAWIAIGYFVAALVVDGIFRGASFCKYLCPIGQFNFVGSLVSPLEVAIRDPAVCASCRTRDCIRGRDGIPGCELHLYQPRKSGNMDCTFCLDCVHACPHDNVGILAATGGKELGSDAHHSGVGRFARRPDLAALVLVLVFGAFANAAGMIEPVADWQDRLRAEWDNCSPITITTLFYLAALLVLPAVAMGAAAVLSRRWCRSGMGLLEAATRYAYALVPLGFGMWLAHYGFHFLAGYDAAVPAAQRFAADRGWTALGPPEWSRACCRPVADWVVYVEILFLDFGLLFSLCAVYRIARTQASGPAQTLGAAAPWAVLVLLLFALGIWIVFQAMPMRGTLAG